MASYGDDTIDGYLYSSYNPYTYRCPKPRSWRHKGYLAAYGDAESYFDNHQRAQLKSILAQINPNLTPRLRKANTKDVGVQVNPRADASVQCSLGPRTLLARKRDALRRRRQDAQAPGSPGGGGAVRFPRTLAVYSPIASRRLVSFLEEEEEEEEAGGEKDCGSSAGSEKGAEEDVLETSVGGPLGPGKERGDADRSEEERKIGEKEEGGTKARVRFQFLEQKYGYFHCRDCNLRWESAYVWCVQGTSKVYFKQFCRTCQKAFNPYRVEDITCQTCRKARCTCPMTLRHVDPKRPHRQDLCGRCKGKRLSCDSTFSFKYII
ncbi:zygote arrest protein 1 [Denticeps clupeoides]|uniref:3CxxC-type domain-containing protein n=1 Tax=Denticeps clupeoides TaxID=299321 RepID=A0AAY4DS53_9TELE|nr:zygote arrest protein 1 [Denticeps clupeoides]